MRDIWREIEASWADPGPQGENLSFSGFLTLHLLRLGSLSKSSVMREYLDPAGLSVPEWRLLATVVTFCPTTFADIVSMSTMDKGQVSRTLRSAQAKGLVATELVHGERRPNDANPSAGSRIFVTITQAGREMYEKVMPAARRYQTGLLDLMTKEERQMLLRVVRRLYEHMVQDSRST